MDFIHAIDIKDFYPCRNISVNGMLSTPNMMAFVGREGIGKNHVGIEKISLEALKSGGRVNIGAITPRAGFTVIKAGLLRANKKLVNGYGEEILYSEEGKDEVIRDAEVELNFEKYRRKHFPKIVSRLSCLYLAERTEAGRDLIRQMIGATATIFDVRVVFQLNMTKVNVSWFDAYCEKPNPAYIHNYWSGINCKEDDKWEYLLDGAIELEDDSLLHVLERGTQIA